MARGRAVGTRRGLDRADRGGDARPARAHRDALGIQSRPRWRATVVRGGHGHDASHARRGGAPQHAAAITAGRRRAAGLRRRQFPDPECRFAVSTSGRGSRAAGDRRVDSALAVLCRDHDAPARADAQRRLAGGPRVLDRHRHRRRADRAGQRAAVHGAGQGRLVGDGGRRVGGAAGVARVDADQRCDLPADPVHARPRRPVVQGPRHHHVGFARGLAAAGGR